jgi:outer membrane protein assembly factor BamB
MRTLRTQLPATVQGGPALDKDFVLLPLANGILVRISLADGGIVHGPDWRALGAEAETQGHVSILGGADFLVTDGSRGLQRLHIADGKIWDKRAELQLAHRIVTAPVVLNRTQAKKEACVLDASDTLTLVDADRLTVLRNWQMPGKVTAGPFVRAGKIGCVVAKNRLVWIDPSEKTPAWEYAFVADVVGAPHLMDGMLVVGDIAGQFVALDPATGRPLGPDLTLKANLAPVAAPLPFGPGRAFAPLTDGTIVIVPLDKLRP